MPLMKILSKKYRRQTLFFLFSLIVSIGIFTYLFSVVSIQEVLTLLKNISAQWILLFLLMSFSMSLFRTWRYAVVLNASGYRPNKIALFLITLVRNFFSDLLPARLGTLIYIYLVQSRLGIPFGAAAASFALAFVFDILSLSLLIILATLAMTSEFMSPLLMAAGGCILALCSGGVLILLPGILNFLAKMSSSLPLITEKMRLKLHNALADTRKDINLAREQGIYWRILALSFGVRIFKYLSLYILLLALVIPLGFTVHSFPLAKVFLGLCSAELAASLPISGLAGFGVYEGTWALVFQLLGYSERIAALTSVSHHLLTQVYGYSLGAAALLVLLLPFFTVRQKEMIKAKGPLTGRYFWVKLAGTSLLLVSLCFLMLPDANSLQNNKNEGQGKTLTADSAVKGSAPKSLPNGRIVFQRPDGIYTVGIEDRLPHRLAERGTYPRWSPDGKLIAFVDGNNIMLIPSGGGNPEIIAKASNARALCFDPSGKSVLFTDGDTLRRVDIKGKKVSTVLKGYAFREVDAAGDGSRLAATVKTPFGFKVLAFDLRTGQNRKVDSGCSASLSPVGNRITVNGPKHLILKLYKWDSLQQAGQITAPTGAKFDNQFWSNRRNWIVSISEGDRHDIYIHHVPSDTAYRITSTGDCNRGDLFISTQN